jgi:hypothetical protein
MTLNSKLFGSFNHIYYYNNMNSKENFVEHLFIRSINIMKTNWWQWPDAWDTQRKLQFLEDSLSYAETNELYEQCAIIRDVKETIK